MQEAPVFRRLGMYEPFPPGLDMTYDRPYDESGTILYEVHPVE